MANSTKSEHIVAVSVRADAKNLGRELRGAGQSFNALAANAQRSSSKVGAAMSNMVARVKMARRELQRGIMGRAGGMARGALGMAGVFGIGAMIQQTRELEMRFSRFGATAGGSIQNMRSAMNAARKAVKETSDQFGIGQDQVLAYAERIQEATGNQELALGTMKQMGKVAMATGADMGDLAGVVEKLSAKLQIGKEDFYATMDVFATQADKGSFELKNLAGNFVKVLGMASRFNATGIGGARQMGALMQMSMRGSGSAAEAETSATRLLSFIATNTASGKLQKTLGMKAHEGPLTLDIIPEIAARIAEMQTKGILAKTGKDKFNKRGELVKEGKKVQVAGVMKELFGELGQKTMQVFIDEQLGRSGGLASYKSLVAAGGSGELLNQKAKFISETPAQKLNKALTKINNAVQSKMLPLLVKLSDKMTGLVPVVQMVMDHFIALAKVFAAFKIGGFLNRAFRPSVPGVPGGGAMSPTLMGQGPLAPGQRRIGRFGAFAGKYGGVAGGALTVAGGLAGSVTGSKYEQGADMLAGVAAMAGGPAGLAAGGTYMVAKLIVTAAKSEIFSEELNFNRTKKTSDLVNIAANFGVAQERAKRRAAGMAPTEQEKKETEAAKAQAEIARRAKVELDKGLSDPIKKKQFEAAKKLVGVKQGDALPEALTGGLFGGIGADLVEEYGGAEKRKIAGTELGKLIAASERLATATKAMADAAARGIKVNVGDTPASRLPNTNQQPATAQ